MYPRFIIILIFVQVFRSLEGAEILPSRVKRGIFGTLTTTSYKTVEEIRYVPATCVYIAPNLPDCRNVRFMNNYPKFNSNAFSFLNFGKEIFGKTSEKPTQSATEPIKRLDNEESTTEQGWGEYFGLYGPVVTVTELKIQPKTVVDSRVMVTYDIRGCKPHDLPFDLERCTGDNQVEIASILPTVTVDGDVRATEMPKSPRMMPENIYGTETDEVQHVNVHSTTNVLPSVQV